MPYASPRRNFDQGAFIQRPDGTFERIGPLKEVNIHLGQPNNYDRGEPSWGMSVNVMGLENYEQVKEIITLVHDLWEKSNGR